MKSGAIISVISKKILPLYFNGSFSFALLSQLGFHKPVILHFVFLNF